MVRRQELQTILSGISGVTHAYFQPPETIKLTYPCIIYEYSSDKTFYADNLPYSHMRKYTITVIDRNPDSPIADIVGGLMYSKLNRVFTTDNLYHYVYELYY